MNYDHILIRYGELFLKGKNISKFTSLLKKNVKYKLKEFPDVHVVKDRSRMFVKLNGQDPQPVMDKIKGVFGIHSFSLALKVENDIEAIQEGALFAIKEAGAITTFKVSARRADKTFPINSQNLNHEVGGYVLTNTENITVDVHNPDVNLRVEVRKDGTYITCANIKGAGGLPVGSSGKAMLMLSGGIDSPVAAYLTMKRGVQIEAIHFHSPPFTSERAKQKVMDLAKKLTRYGGTIRLHVVPFTKIQQHLNEAIPENYTMTAMRRMMLRIAEKIAEDRGALALATGESLGQVASQTLESMNTINEVTNYPILRPLIAMDKVDIIEIARQIDTYDISIRPYEDCCTIFLPANPKTKPRREKINVFEQRVEAEDLINEAIKETEIIKFQTESIEKSDEFGDLL